MSSPNLAKMYQFPFSWIANSLLSGIGKSSFSSGVRDGHMGYQAKVVSHKLMN